MNSVLNFLLILATCTQVSNSANRIATIAVVEYQPILNRSRNPDEIILANAEAYIGLLEKTANESKSLDMMIFPESTLHDSPLTAVFAHLNDTPCSSRTHPEFLRKLSCASANFATYLVVNLIEKAECDASEKERPNCKEFGFVFYNTDVVFDRSGRIASKYRKYHLFGEYDLDKPPYPETVTFETDFGVKFGIFTCFDILFKHPAEDVLGEKIDAAIFPSMWFSQLPFLTSLQTQQMWAHAHDVRLFAAGANNPARGSGGSGVYSGQDGSIVTGIDASGGSQVYIYEFVPGESPGFNPQQPQPHQDPDVLGKEMDAFSLSQDPSVPSYNSTILKSENFSGELCYGASLCCRFDIKISKNDEIPVDNSYVYRLVAFSGVRSFSNVYNGGIEVCGLIACLNASIVSCGLRFADYDAINWPITFERIEIRARFEKSANKTQFPNSLLGSIRPINASRTIWRERGVGAGLVEKSFAIREPQDRLLTFAIYGRDFGQDFPPKTDEIGASFGGISVRSVLLAVSMVLGFVAMV